MWIGILFMPILIRIWIGINMGIWIQIGISTMLIHDTA
jgi:hypothetical protein